MIFSIEGSTFLVSLVTLAVFLYFYIAMYRHWESRGIPFIWPSFSVENIPKYVTSTLDNGKVYEEIKRRKDKLAGVFNVLWSTLIVIHPDFITDILSEYVSEHFVDRGFYYTQKREYKGPDGTALNGRDWKDMRAKLTPDYNSEEIKYMFGVMLEISNNLIEAVERSAVGEKDIDVKEFLALYTTDFIRHSVYNRACNSFHYSDGESPRRKWGFLQESIDNIVEVTQDVRTLLGLGPTMDDATYYYHAIRADMKHREENKDCRLERRLNEMIFEMDESVMNTVFPEVLFKTSFRASFFFDDSFDTSSTTMHFAIYELCKNPDIQNRLRDEINEVIERYDGLVTLEGLTEMTYLQQVIDETLRLYPPVPNRVRICTKDYTLRGTEITIPEGARIIIPILSLHRDSEYYPNPEKFDPERFNDEGNSSLFMPFGEGNVPLRGIHLTLLQAKIGLIRILRKFKLTISTTTKLPLQLNPQLYLRSNNNLYVRAHRI